MVSAKNAVTMNCIFTNVGRYTARSKITNFAGNHTMKKTDIIP